MFDGIAEHEVAERDFFFFFFFYEIAYFFYLLIYFLIYFFLTIWFINVKCFDVLRFFFIILAELALDTILLLRQLVFCTCTYTLFGNIKIHYHYGRVVIVLDFGSDGRGFHSHRRRSYFSVPDIFFNYNIHDIFSILMCHK